MTSLPTLDPKTVDNSSTALWPTKPGESDVTYLILSGPSFEALTRGGTAALLTHARMARPGLPGFLGHGPLARDPDRRQFFVATRQPAVDGQGYRRLECIGILELERSPYNRTETWLKSFELEPGMAQSDVGPALLQLMVAFLAQRPTRLMRPRPLPADKGLDTQLDRMLDTAGIGWHRAQG